MASVHLCCVPSLLLYLLCFSRGVNGENVDSSIGGLVAAAAVAFIFLAVIIAMIIVGFTWNNWYPAMQRAKGKVKMPREYWTKKEEAKMRLINGSKFGSTRAPSEVGLPIRNQDTAKKPASWVQGWNNANPASADQTVYEEMALAMDLEEEDKDDDFKIETTVVDDETLDLGPYRNSTDIVPKPVIEIPSGFAALPTGTNGSVKFSGSSKAGASKQTATLEMMEEPEDDEKDYTYSSVQSTVRDDGEEAVTSFSRLDPSLVAL